LHISIRVLEKEGLWNLVELATVDVPEQDWEVPPANGALTTRVLAPIVLASIFLTFDSVGLGWVSMPVVTCLQ
jgi:hypothetical protein